VLTGWGWAAYIRIPDHLVALPETHLHTVRFCWPSILFVMEKLCYISSAGSRKVPIAFIPTRKMSTLLPGGDMAGMAVGPH
jgi:hypothetical protein